MEQWKKIKETNYSVSSSGKVRNDRTGKILTPQTTKTGYSYVDLWQGKHTSKLIHRLVAEAFIPNPEELPEVNHKNEIKTDNNVENLEWMSRRDNNNYGTRNKRVSEKKEMPVKQIKNGVVIKIWRSQLEAAKAIGKTDNSGNILAALKGRTKTAYGFQWEYA